MTWTKWTSTTSNKKLILTKRQANFELTQRLERTCLLNEQGRLSSTTNSTLEEPLFDFDYFSLGIGFYAGDNLNVFV